MRKVVRTMLIAIGVKTVYEASDGASGLDAIRSITPDLVIVDWEMPMIDGAQFVRMVRSPGEFPMPDVPIIMLSGHGDRWRVVEAARIGAHEYLLKPVSTKALLDRIVAIIGQPRPTVQLGRLLRPAAAPAGGDRLPEVVTGSRPRRRRRSPSPPRLRRRKARVAIRAALRRGLRLRNRGKSARCIPHAASRRPNDGALLQNVSSCELTQSPASLELAS